MNGLFPSMCPSAEGNLKFLKQNLSAFSDPSDILRDPDMTRDEKRAILAAWASDALAVEGALSLRRLENGAVADVDAILAALRSLDAIDGPLSAPSNEPVSVRSEKRLTRFQELRSLKPRRSLMKSPLFCLTILATLLCSSMIVTAQEAKIIGGPVDEIEKQPSMALTKSATSKKSVQYRGSHSSACDALVPKEDGTWISTSDLVASKPYCP